MSGRNRRDTAPIVKPELSAEATVNQGQAAEVVDADDPFRPLIIGRFEMLPVVPLPPAIMGHNGNWYTREQVYHNLGIGNRTWDRWVLAGMKVRQPGTKRQLVHSSELDRMLEMDEADLPPAYKSPYAEKNKARKRKRE